MSSSFSLKTTLLWPRPLICWQSGSSRWVGSRSWDPVIFSASPYPSPLTIAWRALIILKFLCFYCRCRARSGPRASRKSPQESPDKTLWSSESRLYFHCRGRGENLNTLFLLQKYKWWHILSILCLRLSCLGCIFKKTKKQLIWTKQIPSPVISDACLARADDSTHHLERSFL